jgi:glucoamylase
MPLMWAHAEYIKLLRSASGGDIYDCIRTVADRYREGHGRKDLEVWKPNRQVASVRRGDTLRVQAPRPFRLRWTKNEWQTHKDVDAKDSGLGICCADIKVTKSQKAPARFTFFWLDSGQWEGRNHSVDVDG